MILTPKEVKAILSQLVGTNWIMGNLLYGAELRLRECLQFQVKDIDFSYQQITVRSVKGEKDRMIVLPPDCSKMDMTCKPCRNCWDTGARGQRRSIPTF